MRTLQKDIDDLDRMVEGGSPKHEIRSQIRLISREVAALEADYARAVEDQAKTREAKGSAEKQLAELQVRNKKSAHDFLAQKRMRLYESSQLDHSV